MKTNQAWGWLAAGVLAAGLNANYYDGGFQGIHRVAERVERSSQAVLALASDTASPFLAEVRGLSARNEGMSCQLAGTMARIRAEVEHSQTGVEHFEVLSARKEAPLARREANRARMETQIAVQAARIRIAPAAFAPVVFRAVPSPVVCPRVRVDIPQMPMMKLPTIPVVHIETASAGPV